jgi:DNA-binding NtrC family response regulator
MTAATLAGPKRQLSLLLVGDQAAETRLIVDRAAKAGWRTIVCRDLRQAIAMLDAHPDEEVTAIIVDECDQVGDACDAIADLKSRLPGVPLLFVTDSSSTKEPLEALRVGASDFLRRPVAPERLLHALQNAASQTWPHRLELEAFAEKFPGEVEFPSMVGADPVFRQALAQAAISARGHGNILVVGESGVGKDALARAIHAASRRAKAPLRVFNTRGVPEVGLESALFGHRQGAFVGAFESRQGLLQQCGGGTLIIDQVNRLPAALQEKLAEALRSRRVRPVGADNSFWFDVRVIALSNECLDQRVASGDFNRELHELLSTTQLYLPPLRERAGDIGAIARHFLGMFRDASDRDGLVLSDEALALLSRFPWPRNIRQLQTVLLRAAAFSNSGVLTVDDFAHIAPLLREDARSPSGAGDYPGGITLYGDDGHLRSLADIEADILRLAVGHYGGRMSEVARRLEIGRSTLYRKLAKLGFDV